jgi:hypothetical protein
VAMEEWRDITRGILTGVPRTIDRALVELSAGFDINENGELPGRPLAWCTSSAILDEARRNLFFLRALHAIARHVFVLYSKRRSILVGGPVWQRWEANRASAPSTTPSGRCRIFAPPPRIPGRDGAPASTPRRFLACRLSPDRTALLTASLELARVAYRDAIVAQHEARRMGRAVAGEFHDARTILID